METNKETFGDRIVKTRQQKNGMQQKDLAKITGFTAVSVGRYERYDEFKEIQDENARVPPVNFLKELSIATGKSPSYFLFGIEEKKEDTRAIPLIKNIREFRSKADLDAMRQIPIATEVLECLSIDPDIACLCMLVYPYDNMEPTIKNRACVIITSTMECTNGVYLVRTSAGTMIKRVMSLANNKFKIMNDNRLYDEETVDLGDFEIVGKIQSVMQGV